MPSLDFESLLSQANILRNSGKINQAIAAFREISQLANHESEVGVRARALKGAGMSAADSTLDPASSYYRDGLEYFALSEQSFREVGDVVSIGKLYREIATIALNAQDQQVAVRYLQKSVEILEKADVFGELAMTFSKLGLMNEQKGLITEALTFNDKATSYLRRVTNVGFYKAVILFDRAQILTKNNEHHQALELLEESLGWFKADHSQSNYDRFLIRIYGLMSILYPAVADDQSGRKYFALYQELLAKFDPLAAKLVTRDLSALVGS